MFTNFDITPCFLFTVLLASSMVQPSKTQACQLSCQYGGFCLNSRCICPPGLTGPTCAYVDCDNYPCLNGGTCSRGSIPNQDTCQCPDGFVLPFCTTSCLSDRCQNGGTCSDDVCSCLTGFAGPTCQSAVAVYLSPLEVLVTEGDTGNSNVRIHLCRQQSILAATVTVATSLSSAASPSDYVNINIAVTIPIGQVCTPVAISIVSDMIFEPTEVFHLVIFQLPPTVHIVPGQGTATVTIIDDDGTDPPVISNCPFDNTRSTAPGTSSTSVFWPPPTASDNSGDVTLTSSHQSGDTFSLGQTTVTYTAVDGAGNTVLCQFVITVMIDIDECSTGSHTCDVLTSECMNTLGFYRCDCRTGYTGESYFPGDLPTCEDVDECTTTTLCDSRSSTCMNTVGSYMCVCMSGYTGSPYTPPEQPTCTDKTSPIISDCISNTVLGAISQDDDSVPISWTEPTATDISVPVTVMSSHRPGQPFSIGSTTVTYTFTDAAGNSASCSFLVSVFRIILQCPGTVTAMAGSQVSFINPTCLQTNNMPVSSSNCVTAGGSTISSDTQVSCSCSMFSNVQCSFQVFVTGLPITIQCPNPIVVTFGSPLQYTTPSCNRNGNFGSLVTCSHPSGFTPTNDIDVTCTCDSYQAYSCSFQVTVTGAPATIQCPDDMTVQFDSQLTYSNPPCISNLVGSPLSLSSCSPVAGSTIMSDVEVTCTCDTYQNVQCSFMVTVEAYVDCPEFMLLYAGDRLSFINPSCIFMGISSPSTCDPQSGFRVLSQSQQVTCTCDNYPDTQCTFQIITQMDCSKNPCNENCYCEETPSCTNQPSVCSSECRIFGCPVNITSESLSQVNPQSSVEIKCILDGSTAVVDRLNIRLSRSEEGLDGVGINRVNAPDLPSNRKEFTYRVMNVSQDDQFFCILFSANYPIGAVSVTEFVYRLPSISDSPTEINRTTTSVTITWRPWNEDTDVGDPPVVAYIPYYKMDPTQDWMSGSRIQDDQTLDYTASSLESDRNYTFSVAAVREEDGGEGPRGPALTIKTLCIDVVPQMVTTTLTATNDVTVTWQQPTVQCSTGITLFTIYYEIEGDVSSRKAAGTADSNVETFTVDGSLLEPGTTYNIAVTITTDQESAMSEGSTVTTTNSTSNLDRMNNNPAGEPPSSSPVYLVALVIPVLLIIILLVVIIKRIRRKPASESKPVDVQDFDYVNAGVTDDPGDYIALEEQSKNTPAPKYQDLTEKEAPTQVSGYERTILETTDAAPKAMPRQGLKRQTDYQYEDVNLGETDARKLPSVPQPDLQSEDDTEYEVPEMFEEYTGVHINTLGASKPITPRPMKITEYKTFMGRERSKVISEIAQQYMALKTGQQHPWTAAVKLQNKPTNFFKALLP